VGRNKIQSRVSSKLPAPYAQSDWWFWSLLAQSAGYRITIKAIDFKSIQQTASTRALGPEYKKQPMPTPFHLLWKTNWILGKTPGWPSQRLWNRPIPQVHPGVVAFQIFWHLPKLCCAKKILSWAYNKNKNISSLNLKPGYRPASKSKCYKFLCKIQSPTWTKKGLVLWLISRQKRGVVFLVGHKMTQCEESWSKTLYQTGLKLQEAFSNSQAISTIAYFE